MRDYRQARRSKTVAKFAAQVLRADSLGRVSALIAGTAAHLGGFDALCREWASHIRGASGAGALRAFASIGHIIGLMEASQPPGDVSRLSDEEIQAELEGAARRLIERPEVFG
jgi:hypothetical protein